MGRHHMGYAQGYITLDINRDEDISYYVDEWAKKRKQCGNSDYFKHSLLVEYSETLLDNSLTNLTYSEQKRLVSSTGMSLVEYALSCGSRLLIDDNNIPTTIEEMLASENKEGWIEAVQTEIKALEQFNTFDIVPLDEAKKGGRRLVKSKWIFTVKKDANGEIERLKARLVAKGFTQVKDVDYSETFSPFFAHSSLRMMLALAAKNDLKITSWDLTSAFVQTKLDR